MSAWGMCVLLAAWLLLVIAHTILDRVVAPLSGDAAPFVYSFYHARACSHSMSCFW